MFGFEKLEVWQLAIDYADTIYRITRPFPADERFALTLQLRRAAVSVAANIAEGSGRGSNKEFSHYVGIAFGSLMETVSHATIATRQDFLTTEDLELVREQADRLSRMLSGLRRSLRNQKPNSTS